MPVWERPEAQIVLRPAATSIGTGVRPQGRLPRENDESRSSIPSGKFSSASWDKMNGAGVLFSEGVNVDEGFIESPRTWRIWQRVRLAGRLSRSLMAGLFRLDAVRTSSERNEGVGAIALAPGYGSGWVELDPDAIQPIADIFLQPEQVIQGRLFDLQGQPARDVMVMVSSIRRMLDRKTDKLRERSEGPAFGWGDVSALPGWPKPAITDAEGRFTIHDIARGRQASLNIRDPRYAQQVIRIETEALRSQRYCHWRFNRSRS
jgi:hypothetical protein